MASAESRAGLFSCRRGGRIRPPGEAKRARAVAASWALRSHGAQGGPQTNGPGLRDFLQVSAGGAFFRSSRHWPRWFGALHKGAAMASSEILICYTFLQPQGPEARMVEK